MLLSSPLRYRHQSHHVRRPLRSSPHRKGVGHGNQANSESHRPSIVRRKQRCRRRARGPEQQVSDWPAVSVDERESTFSSIFDKFTRNTKHLIH